jgi:hypothetical protein
MSLPWYLGQNTAYKKDVQRTETDTQKVRWQKAHTEKGKNDVIGTANDVKRCTLYAVRCTL